MNSPLHPELIALETRYNSLIDDVEAGHISVDDATKTLEAMQVIDGTGMVWGMDPEGNFVAGQPGGPLSVTDPVRFRAAQLPARPGPAVPPWENGDLMSPPTGDNLHRDGLVTPPVPASPSAQWAGGESGFGAPQPVSKPKKPSGATSLMNRTKSLAGGAGSGLAGSGLVERLLSNKRNLIVGVLAVVGVILLLLTTTGGDDADVPSGGVPAVNGPSEALPQDGTAPVPNGDEVNALLTALTSSQRDLAGGSVVDPGDPATIARRTAEFGSYTANFGLALTAGPAAQDGDGAVSTLTLTDTTTNTEVGSGTVRFVRAGESWRIAAWPSIG